MLVLAYGSLMKIRRCGSIRFWWRCQQAQRRLVMYGWVCSLATTIYFLNEYLVRCANALTAVIDLQAAIGQLRLQLVQGERRPILFSIQVSCTPAILRSGCPPSAANPLLIAQSLILQSDKMNQQNQAAFLTRKPDTGRICSPNEGTPKGR